MLDISRVEEGTLSISAETIALQRLIDDAIDLMRPLAEGMEVQIHAPELAGGNGYVFADNQRLKQVLINLIANAMQVQPPRRRRSRRGGGSGRRARADQRRGLGRGDRACLAREALFVPFERLDAAATCIEGTGLGLAVSRSLIEAMGGTIGAASTPGPVPVSVE